MNKAKRPSLHDAYSALNKDIANIEEFKVVKNVIEEGWSQKQNPNSRAFSIKEVLRQFGPLAANNARIGAFDSFIKMNGLPFVGIINLYSFAVNKEQTKLYLFIPERDFSLNLNQKKGCSISLEEKSLNFSLDRVEKIQTNIDVSAQIGLTKKNTPYLILVKLPLSIFSLSLLDKKDVIFDSLEKEVISEYINKYRSTSLSEIYARCILNNEPFSCPEKYEIVEKNILARIARS